MLPNFFSFAAFALRETWSFQRLSSLRISNTFGEGLLDAIEASTVVPQNLTLARLANTVKLQKCLDGVRIGGVVVRPIGGNDDVLIIHGFNGVAHDRFIWINRDIALTSKIFAGRHF